MTVASVYEMFNSLSTVGKQRFIEWFIGNDISTDIWNKQDINNPGTFAMSDVIDDGYDITTSATDGHISVINFATPKPFNPRASVSIQVARRVLRDVTMGGIKMNGAPDQAGTERQCFITGATFYEAQSSDGTATTVATDIAIDTAFHLWRILGGSADIQYSIDGILKVTKTTNRSTQIMQPYICGRATPAGVSQVRIKYLEVYNT